MSHTQIFAHRGFSGKYPENTMTAFKQAEKAGADGIELDVQLTKDAIPVIIHDRTVNRVTTGKGRVSSYTLQEIQQLKMKDNEHEKIPTFEEFLAWTKNHSQLLNVELKTELTDRSHIKELILPLLNKYGVEERTILSSFDHKALYLAKQEKPHVEAAALVHQAMVNPEDYLRMLEVEGIHFKSSSLLMHEAQALQENGFAIRPYTVNTVDMMRQFFSWGCEGIFTDFPDLALDVRDRRISGY
ncbi:glycerophosphodiester phosphodiesterase family protein [Alkalicoccobacillus murimartini]|uniref:Glycerophosphoryl diester phosphodiesterase n=1 Tax=Alkalicoccobacillus murimartini TaxID=171685 RepID=A0ABT9YBR0_9BACI|nr:glycerophosphodiester phosphodiesterase family protein [Alkalicoccobacillus murimartini]MDQ0205278.1 glycerophosphoryl diester phosphodiesterase [Alkalicoccobacillus murimartini]